MMMLLLSVFSTLWQESTIEYRVIKDKGVQKLHTVLSLHASDLNQENRLLYN